MAAPSCTVYQYDIVAYNLIELLKAATAFAYPTTATATADADAQQHWQQSPLAFISITSPA